MVVADSGFDAGGIVGTVLCIGLVAVIAVLTARPGGGRRGAPIYRRNIGYTQYGRPHGRTRRRSNDGPDGDDGGPNNYDDSGHSGNSGYSGDSGHSGGGWGSGCGGGGGGGD